MPRQKTGGRKAGTPNKRTQDVMEKLADLGCDPLESMARLGMNAEKSGDLALAARMYAELGNYCAPRRKAVEIEHKDEWERFSREELESQYKEVLRKEVRQYEALPDDKKAEYLEH